MSFGGNNAYFHRAFRLVRLLPFSFKHCKAGAIKDEESETRSFTQVCCAEQ
jgi:hypothetical protein